MCGLIVGLGRGRDSRILGLAPSRPLPDTRLHACMQAGKGPSTIRVAGPHAGPALHVKQGRVQRSYRFGVACTLKGFLQKTSGET